MLESCDPTPELCASAQRVVEAGYLLALDDFQWSEAAIPLLELGPIVKVDVLDRSEEELGEVVTRLLPYRVRLLAERVETQDVRDSCLALGFDLFQGYRFTRPETVSRRDLPIQHVQTFKLLKDLRNPALSESVIEESFRRDVALSYKLLRMVNSAAVGGRGIWSIGHAVRLLVMRRPSKFTEPV